MKKIHIIGPQGQKNINDLVIYLILPCNILHAFTQSAADGDFTNYLEILFISIGIQVFCVIYGKLMFRGEAEGRYKCLQYGTICSNAGFLGNPIAEGIYGMEGLVFASVYLIPQRIMMWSEGVSVFTEAPTKKEMLKKIFTHPCIIACEIGIVLMLTGWRPPHFLEETITSVSNCNTAMSMLVIGMILADADPKTIIDKDVLFYTFIYGAFGALVSKTEDINKSAGSIQMVIMIVYFITLFQLMNIDGIAMKVLSYLPISSYSAMFARVAMGNVAVWEVVVSFIILVASIIGVGMIGSSIYRMGTLRYGNPIKITTAIKSLRKQKNK